MSLPTDAKERKDVPLCTGVLDYFPDAIAEVAKVSRAGNEQHHPGSELHWDKSKSTDEADALARHLVQRGSLDTDGQRHSAKVAWRALALLQREIDAEKEKLLREIFGMKQDPCISCGNEADSLKSFTDGRHIFCGKECAERFLCASV